MTWLSGPGLAAVLLLNPALAAAARDQASTRDQAEKPAPDSARTPRKAAGIPFTYSVEGLNDKSSKALFREISVLHKNRGTPARALSELQSWIQQDIKALNEILRAQGFYDNRVSYRLDRRKSPFAVTLLLSEGVQYKITAFKVTLATPPKTESAQKEAEAIKRSLGWRVPKPGLPAESARVVEAEQRILRRLPRIGYPHAAIQDRDIVVDHAKKSMDVTLILDPGLKVFFGEARFSGAPHVSDRYLKRLAPWKYGDVYDSEVIDEFRKTLSESMLFSGISTTLGDPNALGETPVLVSLNEGKPRSYGLGATYGTNEGFGVNAFWEHRNFAGAGEKLRVEGKLVKIEQSLIGTYEVPGFLRSNQWLLLGGGFKRENTDAYVSYEVGASAAVKREFRKYWTVQIGGSLEFSGIDDTVSEKKYALIGGQGLIGYDSTNDIFDPRRGMKLTLNVRPYVGEQNGLLNFYVSELYGSNYWALDRRRRYMIATRFKFGSIIGESADRIPATKLFYAGGGASVRGYGYQAVGPLNAAGAPLGGRSLIEGSIELRARVTDVIGVVPFVDVGSVGNSTIPDFKDKLYWGAGLGFRYYTSFAPVRVDIAVPLNKRPTDSSYQIYISLGQSF